MSYSLFLLFLVLFSQEEANLQQMVYQSQEAGVIHHDYDAYMSIWAKEAKIVGGRGATPGPADTTLSRDQFSRVRKLQYSSSPVSGRRLLWSNPKVHVQKNRATLSVDVTVLSPEGWEKVSERYLLEKRSTGWKVVENRWWMLGWKYSSNQTLYSPEKWKALDQMVKEARIEGESLAWVRSLVAAFRLQEAWGAFDRLSLSDLQDATVWVERGYLALRVGKAEEALTSFRRARELDPAVSLPGYVK